MKLSAAIHCAMCYFAPILVQCAPAPLVVDVAVVGAGLSGLSAARTLLDNGKRVAILEARNRVGGRVLNKNLKNGGVTELGAAFVGPTQDHVLALANELGLQTFVEYNSGNNLAFINDTRIVYSTAIPVPPIDAVTTAEFLAAIVKLDALALTINPDAPWDSLGAKEYDKITFQQWYNGVVTTPAGRAILEVATEAIWSARSDQLSFLYVLAYIAGAGNETMPGNFERLISTSGGAQESRIVGGSGLLPNGLADKIGREKILFNNSVSSIVKQTSGKYTGKYLVTGKNSKVVASQVVVAMSPPLARLISYSPPVTPQRQSLMDKMFMGSIGKANAIYKTPFWRTSNDTLSGMVLSNKGTVQTTFDDSDENATYGAILGFIEADQMKGLDSASEAEIIRRVGNDYVRYLGPQAKNVEEWVVQRWDLEPYSRGGPTAVAGLNVFKPYGPALKKPVGGIHWAGTEASDYWPGYMDGAIRSGVRAAMEILGM